MKTSLKIGIILTCLVLGGVFWKIWHSGHVLSPLTQLNDKTLKTETTSIQQPKPTEVMAALPTALQHRLVLLDFTSRLCYECQQLKKTLTKVMPQYPQVVLQSVDVSTPKTDADQALIKLFKPVSVPVLVFLTPTGAIHTVLEGEQPPETLQKVLNNMAQPSPLSTGDAVPSQVRG